VQLRERIRKNRRVRVAIASGRRFITKDPIRFAGGYNLYAYAHNDPVNFRDPDGRQPIPGGHGGPGFDPLGSGGAPGVGPELPPCRNSGKESSRRRCYNKCNVVFWTCILVLKSKFCADVFMHCLQRCDETTPPEEPNVGPSFDPFLG
jgi:hypothetical protein